VPIIGNDELGAACTSAGPIEATDSCDELGICWNAQEVDGQLVGVCTQFCEGAPDAAECPEGFACVIANQGSINLCIDVCDPLGQDCPDGLGCYFLDGSFVCAPGSDSPIGEPCRFTASCTNGSYCVVGELLPDCAAASCCAGLCSLTEPSCEQPGTECVAFFDGEPPAGFEDRPAAGRDQRRPFHR
jgi:hypothetical protein